MYPRDNSGVPPTAAVCQQENVANTRSLGQTPMSSSPPESLSDLRKPFPALNFRKGLTGPGKHPRYEHRAPRFVVQPVPATELGVVVAAFAVTDLAPCHVDQTNRVRVGAAQISADAGRSSGVLLPQAGQTVQREGRVFQPAVGGKAVGPRVEFHLELMGAVAEPLQFGRNRRHRSQMLQQPKTSDQRPDPGRSNSGGGESDQPTDQPGGQGRRNMRAGIGSASPCACGVFTASRFSGSGCHDREGGAPTLRHDRAQRAGPPPTTIGSPRHFAPMSSFCMRSWRSTIPSRSASGRGGQPGMYTSTGMI